MAVPALQPAAETAEAIAAPRVLEPFFATYEAHYEGKPAGNASMQLVHGDDGRWRMDLSLVGERTALPAPPGCGSSRAPCSTKPMATTAR